LLKVFVLSFFRYVVFSIQYLLVLKSFNIELSFLLTLSLIAATFFVSTVVPTFALTEITVRGVSAIYFFGLYLTDTMPVLAASLILWIINLAIPALLGTLFIWRLKFFKE